MMGFVRDKVRQDVTNVQREILPDIPFRGRHPAPVGEPKRQQRFDTRAAAFQRRNEVATADGPQVDQWRSRDPVLRAKGLDPAAPRIVEMGGNRPNGPPSYPRNGGLPQVIWHVLDQTCRDPIVRPPGCQDGFVQIGVRHQVYSPQCHRVWRLNANRCEPRITTIRRVRQSLASGELRGSALYDIAVGIATLPDCSGHRDRPRGATPARSSATVASTLSHALASDAARARTPSAATC